MVYQIFSDGIDRRHSHEGGDWCRVEQSHQQHQQQRQQKRQQKRRKIPKASQFYANLLIFLIKFLLIVYDVLTLPIYFVVQRPDRRAQETRRHKSRQVDANTWVGFGRQRYNNRLNDRSEQNRRGYKFMGSTVSEIFSNAVEQYNSKPCLGYRALVTCPIITMDENRQHVFKDQSFRSDFTWYTFGQIGQRVIDLASGLYFNSIFPSSRAMFMASSCLEWFCMAHACFQLAIQLVLWPESNNDLKTLHSIIMGAHVETLLVSCDQLTKLCQYLRHAYTDPDSTFSTCLKKIIIIDWQFAVDFNELLFVELGQTLKQCGKLTNARPVVLSIGQIEEAGIENPIELLCSRALSDEKLDAPISVDDRHISSQPAPDSRPEGKSRIAAESVSVSSISSRQDGDSLPRSKWMIGGELITAPCMSAPTRRKNLSGKGKIIDGNNEQLQASLLNSYRDANNCSPTLSASRLKDAKPHDLALILYTYGSLGQLKAIMMSHSQLARSNHELYLDGIIGLGDTHCAVLGLDCIIELMSEICIFSHGGSIGYSNNLKTLFYDGKELFERDRSDLETANPTYLLVRPYILEQMRASLQNYLKLQLNPIVSFIFKNVLYDYKSFWNKRHFTTPLVDRLFCSRLRRFFGSKMDFILCNGTTDCSETKDFFAFMVNLPIIELYGPNEAVASMLSAIDSFEYVEEAKRKNRTKKSKKKQNRKPDSIFDQQGCEEEDNDEEDLKDFCNMQLLPPRFNRNIYRENLSKNILITSSIFCPTSGTRIRLEDWVEFRLSDSPYPRGRLVIGGDTVCMGYLDHRDLLTPAIEEDRGRAFFRDTNGVNWFRTGDIARAFPDGSFEIISAISNIIKMADGQLVSLSQIEHILRNNQFVDNVCALCGGDDGSFVINLVVPNLRRIALKSPNEANLKMAIGMEPEPDELVDVEFRREVCNDRLLCEFVTDHLKKLLSKSGLSSIKNRFLLVPEIWTPESELVTTAFEPNREAIQKFYANDIQSLVRIQARKGLRRLSDNRRHKPVQWIR